MPATAKLFIALMVMGMMVSMVQVVLYIYEEWQERQDLNPRPAVLETAALPAELRS